jgi:hypothetical protein
MHIGQQTCARLRAGTIYRRSNMLELTARWGHNVLITLTGLLTIAMVVWAA